MGNLLDKKQTEKFHEIKTFYRHGESEQIQERTKQRLIQIENLGMTLCGLGQFGIDGIMSGLYIEKVWSYEDEDWNGYMSWVAEMKQKALEHKIKSNLDCGFDVYLYKGNHYVILDEIPMKCTLTRKWIEGYRYQQLETNFVCVRGKEEFKQLFVKMKK